MIYLPGPNYALDDFNLRDRLAQIISERKIEAVVETGLNDGQSTLAFCKIAPKVYGIDYDPACVNCTINRLKEAGVTNGEVLLGNSPDVLRDLMPRINPSNTLFFLDAHWGGECPILEEIAAIPRDQGVLVFHDFQVPGKDFGWDHMLIKGQYFPLNYDFLRPSLIDWSPTHEIEYAKAVSASSRGFAFVYPK